MKMKIMKSIGTHSCLTFHRVIYCSHVGKKVHDQITRTDVRTGCVSEASLITSCVIIMALTLFILAACLEILDLPREDKENSA